MKTKGEKLYILLILITSIFFSCNNKTQKTTKGIIGLYCSEPDLTSIKGVSVLSSLNQKWDESVDYEGDTSGEWNGYIISPVSGDVNFHIKTNKFLQLKINDKDSIKIDGEGSGKIMIVKMVKGKTYPINLVFYNPGKHEEIGWFNVEWSWNENEKSQIPLENLYYTEKESEKLNFLNKTQSKKLDKSDFIYADVKNVIVYYEPGRFAAWPANGGIWSWGNEILLSFSRAYYKENEYHHAIDRNKPLTRVLSRSIDGGKNWVLDDTTSLNNVKNTKINTKKIDYSSPGFALRNSENIYQYSYDRGKTWKGPFVYPDFNLGDLTARTDYLVKDDNECLIFTSAKVEKVQAALQDRAMCIKTSDGGLNYEFVSWMTELDSIRSVMPATVRIDKNHLVSALRRRLDPPKDEKYGLPRNWIDVYDSYDNGKTWQYLNKIANTDTGIRNGNPPSMVQLKNGTLCVIYGYRGLPYGIHARISSDNGKTWSKEIILREDAISWDLGYLRSVVREDGKVVSVYYYATKERHERHIAATIWDPTKIIRNVKP
jgi:uncharacterized protein YdeI (BOF family)